MLRENDPHPAPPRGLDLELEWQCPHSGATKTTELCTGQRIMLAQAGVPIAVYCPPNARDLTAVE